MSSRQPASNMAMLPRQASLLTLGHAAPMPAFAFRFLPRWKLNFNLKHSVWMQSLQEILRSHQIKFLVARLHAKKETVFGGEREPGHVENGMIRRRQSVHRQHAEDSRKSRAENSQFECNRDEGRPAVIRLASDIQRKANYIRVVAHAEAEQAAQQSAGKNYGRKGGVFEADCLSHAFNRHGRESIDAFVAGVVRTM